MSQVTFIFLAKIYYNMNFICHQNSSQVFPGTLRSISDVCSISYNSLNDTSRHETYEKCHLLAE